MRKYPESVDLEDVPCPNGCDKDDIVILSSYDRVNNIVGEFDICRCRQCGLQRTNPRPTAATIGAYYPDSYAPYHIKNNVKKKKLTRLLGLEARLIPSVPVGRLLEVGCSAGAYLDEMAGAGWDVEGIEFSEKAALAAMEKGYNVKVGAIEDVSIPKNTYDIIAAWMVLEHLHEPILSLKKLRAAVTDNGYLVASVPDAASISRHLFKACTYDLHLPAHLYHFTPQTLSNLMKKAGWSVVRVRWQRNSNTLLASFCYWAKEKNKLVAFSEWLKGGRSARYIRVILSILLGLTKQSGRIEIWAVPVKNEYYP